MLQRERVVVVILILTNISLLFGCGQAMLTSKLNALNKKFEKRLQIDDISLPPIKIGELYNAQIRAINGTPPYKWKIIQGELPKGLKLEEATGKISGIPQGKANNPIVIMLSDNSGNPNNYVIQSFILTMDREVSNEKTKN